MGSEKKWFIPDSAKGKDIFFVETPDPGPVTHYLQANPDVLDEWGLYSPLPKEDGGPNDE